MKPFLLIAWLLFAVRVHAFTGSEKFVIGAMGTVGCLVGHGRMTEDEGDRVLALAIAKKDLPHSIVERVDMQEAAAEYAEQKCSQILLRYK